MCSVKLNSDLFVGSHLHLSSKHLINIDEKKKRIDVEIGFSRTRIRHRRRVETPAKRATEKAKASRTFSFFPLRFSFLRRSPPSSRSWILKRWYGQQRKAATRDEIFFFLFIIIIFEVPTNAGGVSNGRTGRTLERAGNGSHLDVEERTVRASLSLWSCLRNQSRWIELRDEEWSGECSEEI